MRNHFDHLAKELGQAALGPSGITIVNEPITGRGQHRASARCPASYETVADAVRAAVGGGSLCVRSWRLPPDFTAVRAWLANTDVNMQLMVPSLSTRASDLPRIIDEYVQDAIAVLGSTCCQLRSRRSPLGSRAREKIAARDREGDLAAARATILEEPVSCRRPTRYGARIAVEVAHPPKWPSDQLLRRSHQDRLVATTGLTSHFTKRTFRISA